MLTFLYIPELFGVSVEVYFILFILAIPIFFLWKWIFKRYFIDDKKRKVASLIATLMVTPIIYFVIVFFTIMSWCYYPESDFDKQKWSLNKEKRFELSRDIIESKMLIGKTKSEVRGLLGEEGNSMERDRWEYYLGFVPGIANIDPDYLEIKFKNGRVVSVVQCNS